VKRKGAYVPERGDAVWITLDPQAGHEQAGRRPALVLSPAFYNARAGLALLCPITGQVKGYPFEVPLPELKSHGTRQPIRFARPRRNASGYFLPLSPFFLCSFSAFLRRYA
jgi:mRNA-degrading endonuclease toxin of MazEF toxin-antitoxin module